MIKLKPRWYIILGFVISAIFSIYLTQEQAYAGIVIGGGGGNPVSGGGSGNGVTCGGNTGKSCAGTMWVYYTITDPSKPAKIGSIDAYANEITISDCGPYGGFWIFQKIHTDDQGTLKYRTVTGARTWASKMNYLDPSGSWSTRGPKKGAYMDVNSNVEPKIYNYPACKSGSNSQYWTCQNPDPANEYWITSENTIKGYFKQNNGNSTNCTIGNYTGDCFGSSSPLTYFCYGNDPVTEETFTLSYNLHNGTGTFNNQTCKTTSGSCDVTVRSGTPTKTNYYFAGWNTKADGTGTTKAAGSKYTLTQDRTLHAIWRQYTYTLTYNANGGSNPPAAESKTSGSSPIEFTIKSGTPTPPTGKIFTGWNTKSDGTGTAKAAGAKWSISENKTLYAQYDYPTYSGTFTGAITRGDVTPTDKVSLISGSSYLGSYDTAEYSATYTGTITRNDSETNISSLTAKGKFQTCTSTTTSTCSDIDGTSFSGGLAINGTKSSTNNAGTGTVSRNGSKTVCRRLAYIGSATVKNGTQTDGSWTGTSVNCYTVYRPTRATFSGTVATPFSNNDTNLSTITEGLMGNGSDTSYNIKTTYTITRTNNDPTKAKTKFTTSDSSQPTTASTLSNELENSKTQNPTANNTKTVTVSVGTSINACFFLTYEDWVEYYNTSTRLSDNYHLGKTNGCVDIYNPQYATFTGDIAVTSSTMTGNATNGFRGNGYDTTYTATSTFKVTRNNSTPETASSRYRYYIDNPSDTNASYAASKHPAITATPAQTASNKKNTEYATLPVDIEFPVPNGATRTKCFYLSYDNKVGYIDGSIFSSAQYFNGKAHKCVDFYNPLKFTATFSASIRVTNGTYVSDNSDVSNGKIGNGLRSRFNLTPTYTLKRTNNSPTIGVYSRYAVSDSAQPTSSATKTNSNSLTYNQTQDISSSATTVTVPIGDTAQQCFYITYDANVVLIGDDDASAQVGIRNGSEDRDFAGKKSECYTFTNPVKTYTAHFNDATTVGTLDAHDRLVRTNDNHDGKITNQDRITTGNDDVIGKYEWAWPSSDKYLASFTHTISRTDDVISDTNNNYYVSSAKVNWKIQYQLNNSGVWQDYTTSLDNSSSIAVSGSFYLTGKGTTGVKGTTSTKPKFIMNINNVGTHTIHCQRIAYNAETYYESEYDPDNLDGHRDKITGYSTTTRYSTPVCVSIKNPNWHESDGDILTHQIDVTGQVNGTEFDANELTQSGNNYETLAIYPTIFVNHKLSRTDSGDDESDAVFVNKFWQKSIYNNNNYKAQTNLSAYEKVIGSDTTARLVGVVAGDNVDGSLKVKLGASSKNNGETWASSKSKGASKLVFNATGTDRYSIMAGLSKTFTIATNNLPTRWTVRYKKIIRKEYYTYGAAADAIETFDRIEKVDSEPKVSSPPAKYTSEAVSFTLNRPYNFKITGDTPSVISGSGNIVAFAGDVLSVNYKIRVSKENNTHHYITDPNHTDNARYVYAVTYVLPVNISASDAQVAHATTSGIETNICSHFNTVAKSGSCTILTDTDNSHPNKLTKHASSSVNPNAIPAGAVTDTIFRHVYDLDNYDLGYTTSTITVPSNLAVGEKFCIAVAIRNYSSASNAYYITNSSCRNISKRPAMQVWGGSIITNGGVNTSQSSLNNKLFGSWTDYMVIASREIKRMTSGAASISGAPAAASLCNRNTLTIANTNCAETSNQLGFSAVDARTDFVQKLLHYITKNTNSITDLPNYNSSTKTHTISSGVYIIRSNSDITINRNIIMAGQYANRKDAPQVIIVAPNIKITSSVTRIDAWLIASDEDAREGTIDTCSDIAETALSATKCTNQLIINGALYAANINFKRTFGGDAAQNTLTIPAEITNFSPSLLIWGANNAMNEPVPATTYIRKLPARY